MSIIFERFTISGFGRDWQSRGHGFEPRYLHQKRFTDVKLNE